MSTLYKYRTQNATIPMNGNESWIPPTLPPGFPFHPRRSGSREMKGKKGEGDRALDGRKMALDGQVTYLSTESAANFPRPRTPRRSPRLRTYEDEEEQTENERVQSNLAMRAPIIGYEVVDQRQKFTVQ